MLEGIGERRREVGGGGGECELARPLDEGKVVAGRKKVKKKKMKSSTLD